MTDTGQESRAKTVAPSSSNAPIDYQAFVQFCGNKVEIANKLLSSYVQHSRQDFVDAEQAVVNNDSEKIRQLCHKIAGSAGNARAQRVRKAAEQLGRKIREGKNDEAPEALKCLMNESKQLIDHINLLLHQSEPG